MASSPSASLRLELMATGDQSGTWGDTTNTNLGTLLEQAITGYLSVAQGDVANLTLTTTNYASDQARNAVIRITGALTATRNVVIQTAAKLYTIANDTTGGFSIVVKTAAGTGVSVPPGAMVDVYSDGINAVQAANYWTGSIGGIAYLDAGAAVGPNYDLFRDSTSPAISDILGRVTWNGRDSAGNKQEYASIETSIIDPTSTSEDGALGFYVVRGGTRTLAMSIGAANTGPFSVIRSQAFTGDGTYTPHANMVYCIIECVGGGGGGGGVAGGATSSGGGGGGGAGGYSSSFASSATIGASQTVTIGAAGAAGSAGNNSGGNGGATSLGAICVANGGTGGGGGNGASSGGGGSGAAVGTGNIAAGSGASGDTGPVSATITTVLGVGAAGGSTVWGGGGLGSNGSAAFATALAGLTGTGKGSGGGGAGANATTNTAAGGTGAIGFLVVVEFCSA